MSRWISTAAIVLALTPALAACGDDDEKTSTSSAPTKAQFIARTCAIEAAGNRKLEAAGQSFQHGTSEKQFVDEKVLPIAQTSLVEPLDALTPPQGDEQQVDAIIAAARQALADLKADPESIRAPQGSAKDPFRRFQELAAAYGLRCPSGQP